MPCDSFRLTANAFARPPENVAEEKAVIFISAEGTCTEPDYFNLLNRYLKRECPFILHVLRHDDDTASDPRHVLDLLEECRDIRTSIFASKVTGATHGLTEERVLAFFDHPESFTETEKIKFRSAVTKMGIDVDYYRHLREVGQRADASNRDEFVLVIDRDSKSHTRETLVEILEACRKKHIEFCLSNPCFDFWLILHLEVRLTPAVLKKLLENEHLSDGHTYSSKLISENAHHGKSIPEKTFRRIYLPKMRKALKRANKFAVSENEALNQVGTRIPELIKRVLPWL